MDLMKVRVLASDEHRLSLRVWLLPADEGQFCLGRAFAWRLVDPFENEWSFKSLDVAARAACSKAVEAADERNMAAESRTPLADALVRSVALVDLANYTELRPRAAWIAAEDSGMGRAEIEDLYPQATYQIEFSDPGLCGHLPVGFEWRSTAYGRPDDEFQSY